MYEHIRLGALLMLWFFDRDDESLTVETRYESRTSEFVCTVRFPDGSERTERFGAPETFGLWLREFERHLAEKNWTNRTGPIILPHESKNRLVR